MDDRTVRRARAEDTEAIAAFTEDTWEDWDAGDYIPEAFPEWVATDGPDQYTAVTVVDDDPVGLAQSRLLTGGEAWFQGLRVHPDHRGRGHALAMTRRLQEWSRERGATVARNMVFGWNEAGLGQSRAAGFDPGPSCRWARPEPADSTDGVGTVSGDTTLSVHEDRDAAWRFWTHSHARTELDGLVLDDEVAWGLAELTRDRFERLADAGRPITVAGKRTRGTTVRLGARERDGERVVDYAVAAWADADAARVLFDAIREDATARGGDGTRVLIPESPQYVSDAALAGVPLSDEPVYVFTADLTGLPADR
jgi:GNAT superfamily N-acetyltransferase